MRIFYDNLIDATGVAIAATTEESTLPDTNVVNELRGKVWRSAPASAIEKITFDLLTAQAVTACIVLDHTIQAGLTEYRCDSSSDNFAANKTEYDFTYAVGVMSVVFASDTKRYWRVYLEKGSGTITAFDVGRIFIGTYWTTPEDPDHDGVEIEHVDLSEKTKSKSGQTYTDQRDSFRKITVPFSQVSQAFINSLNTAFAAVGTHTSFFIQIDPSGDMNEVVYVKFASEPKVTVSGYDGTNLLWDVKLSFEEQL